MHRANSGEKSNYLLHRSSLFKTTTSNKTPFFFSMASTGSKVSVTHLRKNLTQVSPSQQQLRADLGWICLQGKRSSFRAKIAGASSVHVERKSRSSITGKHQSESWTDPVTTIKPTEDLSKRSSTSVHVKRITHSQRHEGKTSPLSVGSSINLFDNSSTAVLPESSTIPIKVRNRPDDIAR